MPLRPAHVLLSSLLLVAACGKSPPPPEGKPADGKPSAPAAAASAPMLLISAEDLRTVGEGGASAGAVITGSVQPERRADLRAEIPAVVLQVVRENGEAVKKGELLVRLDDTAIRDSLASAEEAARAAAQAFDQAERQVQRLATLQAQGMTSMQAYEDAQVRRNNAQSDLVAARSRVVAARQQLQRTEVRAPFDGTVSERKVSAGDTAQVGKELVKVIDPASMRFEGSVSADRMSEVQVGRLVTFKVNGYPQVTFRGRVKRVDASADPSTRQVEVLVGFEGEAPRVAGLYAEGRVEATGPGTPTLPESAIVRSGAQAYVWRVGAGRLAKVPVQLGERDARTGELPLRGGLATGDRVLRNPSAALVDGQPFEFAKPASAPALASGR